jgi:flagellar biosynthetic protein FliQ
MGLDSFVGVLRSGIFLTLVVSAPILLIAMVIGLVISIFQAVTSIQDQTLTFVPKILAILITLGILIGWMFTQVGQYTIRLFNLIGQLGG